jgi:hypothetical protein
MPLMARMALMALVALMALMALMALHWQATGLAKRQPPVASIW